MQLNYIEREKNPNGMIVLDVLQYDAQIKCRILQPGMRKCLTVNQKAKKMSFAKKKIYTHKRAEHEGKANCLRLLPPTAHFMPEHFNPRLQLQLQCAHKKKINKNNKIEEVDHPFVFIFVLLHTYTFSFFNFCRLHSYVNTSKPVLI